MTDMQIIQNFLEGVQESGKTTTAYDTTAEVVRADENSVWVHIPGGVAETPVARTINAKKGDVVQVRVSGGTAFIVGNATAPPTDDATAIVAQGTADVAKETADVAKEVADAAAAQVQTVRNYFWHDAAGAHVSTVEGDATTGNNVLIDSDSMDIRNGETVLSSYSADGMAVYAKDSGAQIEISHLGYALGENEDGDPEKAPYYSLGIRSANSVIGNYSVAEGYGNTASGAYSHAEGKSTKATNVYAHAEGAITTASGSDSHAEGFHTTASGSNSHAEGFYTTASGSDSHAEGNYTIASGNYSHAEGFYTTASRISSHAAGYYTKALQQYQTVIGKYNDNQSDTLFEVGNGTADDARSNAFQVHSNGNVALGGELTDMSGNTLLTSAGQAVKAVGDKNGNDITTTYAPLNISPTWTVPTFTSSRATCVGGGFYTVGKVVYVQMIIKMNVNYTSGSTLKTDMIVNNTPAPAVTTAFAVTNRTSGVPVSMMSAYNEGGIRLAIVPSTYPLRQNDEIIITGQYIKA